MFTKNHLKIKRSLKHVPVVVGGAGGGGAGVADALVAEDTVEAVLEAEFVDEELLGAAADPEAFPEAAAAAAAATLFRLK